MSFERVDERIRALELKLDGLQSELHAANRKSYEVAPRFGYRIAEVTSQAAGNTFTARFVDGLFNESEGLQTPAFKARQITGSVAVHNLAGTMPPYGTKLLVFNWSHRWWTYWSEGGSTPPPPQEVVPFEWQEFNWSFNGDNWYYDTDATPQDQQVELYDQTNRREAQFIWGTNVNEVGTPSEWGVGNTRMFSQRGTTQAVAASGSLEILSTNHPQESYYLTTINCEWDYWRTSTGISAPSPLENLGLAFTLDLYDSNGVKKQGVSLGALECTPTDSNWANSISPFLNADDWKRASFTRLVRTIPVVSGGVQTHKYISLRAAMQANSAHSDIALLVNIPSLTFIRMRPHASQIG